MAHSIPAIIPDAAEDSPAQFKPEEYIPIIPQVPHWDDLTFCGNISMALSGHPL